jgi:hypothetical protein
MSRVASIKNSKDFTKGLLHIMVVRVFFLFIIKDLKLINPSN